MKDNIPGKIKDVVGTLVLTDRRVIFVEANKEENYTSGTGILSKRSATFRYSDIDDLGQISANANNISIPLNEIVEAKGSEGIIHPPELKLTWKENGIENRAVFSQELIGGRKKSLKDWVKTILGLRDGRIEVKRPTAKPPSGDTLGGRILQVLGDMQEKGLFEIEQQVESTFGVDLDPDQVQSTCENLAAQGFLDRNPDRSGEVFYRKRSPLGEDGLSS